MAENITDRQGRVIGKLVDQGNITILLDDRGYRIGHYDRTHNTTVDGNGRVYCRGNQLTRLL